MGPQAKQQKATGTSTIQDNGNTFTISVNKDQLREARRRTDNDPKHLIADARERKSEIEKLNKQKPDFIEVFYLKEASKIKLDDVSKLKPDQLRKLKVALHTDSAEQSRALIKTLCGQLGIDFPEHIRKASVKDLIGKNAGQNGGNFDKGALEKLYKQVALLSKTIFDLAAEADSKFSKKFNRDIFLDALEKEKFVSGDYKGSCNDQLDGENQKLIIIIRALEKSKIPPVAPPTLPDTRITTTDYPVAGFKNFGGTQIPLEGTGTKVESVPGSGVPKQNKTGRERTIGTPGFETGLNKVCTAVAGCFS